MYPGEPWVSKSAGAHSTKSLKISGCKRWCPKDLRVRAPVAPALTHSLLYMYISGISTNLPNFVPLPWILDNRCYHKFSSKRFEYLDFTNSMVFAEIFIISKNIMTRQIRNFILEIFDLWTMMLICLSFITMTFIIWFSNSIINTISKNYRFGRLKS